MIERALILSNDDILTVSDFPITQDLSRSGDSTEPNLNLLENESSLIKEAMKRTNYNQKKAATLLGISRDALIRRMKKFRIKIEKNLT